MKNLEKSGKKCIILSVKIRENQGKWIHKSYSNPAQEDKKKPSKISLIENEFETLQKLFIGLICFILVK